MTGKKKLQIALYWGAACGGCDVAVLDTNEFVLDLAAAADIRFWPIAVDGKYSDVEAMSDGELDVAFFSGAVRNSENEHVAKLLRRKSKTMIAFGACAHMGGVPGLANLTTRDEIFTTAFLNNASIEPGNRMVPSHEPEIAGLSLNLPMVYRRVYRLSDIVSIDYLVPGCPPVRDQVRNVLQAVVSGELPPRNSVLGASGKTLCEDCRRSKAEKKIRQLFRPHEIIQNSERCLMEQGILCMGAATRSGCGVRCPNSNQGCRGCYGPPPGVADQGTKFLSALASTVDSKDPAEIDQILSRLPDFVGYGYRFGLPASMLQRRHNQ